jgi:hypothetical protein
MLACVPFMVIILLTARSDKIPWIEQDSEEQSHGLQDHHTSCPMTFVRAKLRFHLKAEAESRFMVKAS